MALIVVDEKDVKSRALTNGIKPLPFPFKMLITMVVAALPTVLKPPIDKQLKSILIDARDILNDAALD